MWCGFLALLLVTARASQVEKDLQSILINNKNPVVASAVKEVFGALVENGATPEAREAVSIIMPQLEAIEGEIQKAHVATASALNGQLDLLKTTTDAVVAAKKLADKSDETWVQCVGEEKALRLLYDKATKETAAKEANQAFYCANIPTPNVGEDEREITFSCNMEEPETCTSLWTQFKTRQTTKQNKFGQTVSKKVAEWNSAFEACENAKKELTAAQDKQRIASNNWAQKQETCAGDKGQAELAKCAWARDLQSKCSAKTSFETLRSLVDTKDNVHSEPDRRQEWTATKAAVCLLGELHANNPISDKTSQACIAAVDYSRDVGILGLDSIDQKHKEYIAPDKFTCNEVAFTFKGVSWQVPATVTSADDYVYLPTYQVRGPYQEVLKSC